MKGRMTIALLAEIPTSLLQKNLGIFEGLSSFLSLGKKCWEKSHGVDAVENLLALSSIRVGRSTLGSLPCFTVHF